MFIRTYTLVAAAALTLVATAGLSGLRGLGGPTPLLLFSTAAIFAYLGSRQGDAAFVRSMVGGLGALYLIVGAAVAATLLAFGLSFDGTCYVETLGFGAFGALSVLCARTLAAAGKEGPIGARDGAFTARESAIAKEVQAHRRRKTVAMIPTIAANSSIQAEQSDG
jgi:hypothetical protein